MGQQRSAPTGFLNRCNHQQQSKLFPSIQHQGLLKLRKLPFKNSIKISDSPKLYLQNLTTSLTKLLSERMGGNRLFTQQDIVELSQTCLYTIAYLQENNVLYKDLCTDNIFYDMDQGIFKLLPVELLSQSSYQLVSLGKKFRNISPQMILALRMQQNQIQDQIFHQSNVFMLGMLLLQVCTLKSSSECYDDDNFDILDQIIQDRLDMIRQNYPPQIAQLLTRMLEYDYTKRIGFKQLSMYVSQQLTTQRNNTSKVSKIKNQDKSPISFQQIQKVYRQSTNPVSDNQNNYINDKNNRRPPQYDNQKTEMNYPLKPMHVNNLQSPYQYHQNLSQKNQKYKIHPGPRAESFYNSKMNKSTQLNNQPNKKCGGKYPNYNQQYNRGFYAKQQIANSIKYPSIVKQPDFQTRGDQDDCTEFSIHKIKEEIQKSRRKIQQFNRIQHTFGYPY